MASVKWVRFGLLTLEATVSILRTAQAGAVVFFLKSEPGPVAVVSARPGGGTGGGLRATNPKVKAVDSGGPTILGSLRAEIAFDQCGLPSAFR